MKRFLYYFAWSIGIGVIVYAGLQFQQSLVVRSQETFNPVPLWVYIAIFPVVIGLLMRMPKFLQERTERRIIGFDWSKFLAIGLSAFFILILAVSPFLQLGHMGMPQLLSSLHLILFSGTTAQTIAGLVFGYVLLDSFKREESRGTGSHHHRAS